MASFARGGAEVGRHAQAQAGGIIGSAFAEVRDKDSRGWQDGSFERGVR